MVGHDPKGFCRKVAGVSLRNKVRSSVICEELRRELLLLCIERRKLRWFGHLVRMVASLGGVLGMSSREETPGQVQVERLYLSTGLGMLLDPPVRVG